MRTFQSACHHHRSGTASGEQAGRQRPASREFFTGSFIELELLTHHDLKPSFAIADDTKHLFVSAAGDEPVVNVRICLGQTSAASVANCADKLFDYLNTDGVRKTPRDQFDRGGFHEITG